MFVIDRRTVVKNIPIKNTVIVHTCKIPSTDLYETMVFSATFDFIWIYTIYEIDDEIDSVRTNSLWRALLNHHKMVMKYKKPYETVIESCPKFFSWK
jgi:hypothetical protein